MKKTVDKKPAKKDDLVHLCLEYGREQFVGKGKDIYEAWEDMDKPTKIYKSAVIVIRRGDAHVSKVIGMTALKRIMSHGATRSAWLKLFEKI